MFTGIIETQARLVGLKAEGSNVHFTLETPLAAELKIDQSVAHNGVCLTVVAIEGSRYTVTAVEETLKRTNLGQWELGQLINLERAMLYNGRLDGHIVQGHVDDLGHCLEVRQAEGSWYFRFGFAPQHAALLVDKGSVCINGVSLTVISPDANSFSVTIIPYTYEHTNFAQIQVGDTVNLEFDILGKYIARHAALYAARG